MKVEIQSGTSDKTNWLTNYTLSDVQFKQLVLNKLERAKKDQLKLEQLKKLVQFTE